MTRLFCKSSVLPLAFALSAILMSSFAPLDSGEPSINAVCRITLRDGRKIEGIIQIVSGGYDGFRKNGFGFYFKEGNNLSQFLFFNIDAFGHEINSHALTQYSNGKKVAPEVFYLSSIKVSNQFQRQFDEKNNTWTEETCFVYKYEVSKTLNVYSDLAESLWIPPNNSGAVSGLKPITINVNEIDRFELLREPSERWLSLIKNTRKKRDLISAAWEDYQEPLWFHEVKKNEAVADDLSRKLGSRQNCYTYQW